MYFANDSKPRPCWHCRWYDGIDQIVALCAAPGARRTMSSPDHGCSRFEREPGADDVPEWTPMQAVVYPIRIAAKVAR
jgi:hypothetical protein